MDVVRLGIVGVGGMGTAHSQYLLQGDVKRCELRAVCDIDEARLAPFKDIKTYTRAEDLLRSGEVDAVLVATPHYGHTSIGVAALDQGIHVLVEKPISVHKADCERLVAAHRRNPKRVFSAMFQMRTAPLYKKIKRLLESGELGPIQRINWIITAWFRSEAYYASGGWRATWKGEGGGVLLNQCPHNLDLYQWFFGMPSRIRAFCNFGKYHSIETEDEVTAYMEHPDGATAVFIASTGEAPGTDRLEIAADRGRVIVEHGRITYLRNEVGTREFCKTNPRGFGIPDLWHVDIPVPQGSGSHAEITQNFVDAILDGAPLIAPAEEGIHSVELANAMIYSALGNQTVELPLDSAAYEKRLQRLVAESRFEKKVVQAAADTDISKSFR